MSRTAVSVTAFAAGSLAPGLAEAQERALEWGWGMHPMSWMWGTWGLVMSLMMLVFWGVAIVAVVLGLRWLAGQGETSPSDRALEILRERYARGEINAQEFEAKRRDLQGTR